MKLFYAILALALIIVAGYTGANVVGWPVLVIVGGSGLVGWICWLKFSYKVPAEAKV